MTFLNLRHLSLACTTTGYKMSDREFCEALTDVINNAGKFSADSSLIVGSVMMSIERKKSFFGSETLTAKVNTKQRF